MSGLLPERSRTWAGKRSRKITVMAEKIDPKELVTFEKLGICL